MEFTLQVVRHLICSVVSAGELSWEEMSSVVDNPSAKSLDFPEPPPPALSPFPRGLQLGLESSPFIRLFLIYFPLCSDQERRGQNGL